MYKRILVATDGSSFAAKGAREGVRLAKALGATITGVYVAPPYVPPIYSEAGIRYSGAFSAGEYKKMTERIASKALGPIERAARAAGVRCRTRLVTDPQPWRGILRAASDGRCDAIVIGSHGLSAVGGLIIGSEASRVLAHAKLPVLVVR
jgi:nucleotide-binding universal stress UspA family protein